MINFASLLSWCALALLLRFYFSDRSITFEKMEPAPFAIRLRTSRMVGPGVIV